MDVSVIIVSWNVADLLMACLESLYRTPLPYTFEVLVVDSASTDDTVARVRARFPQVRLFALSENVGFTKGNNIALKEARGRYLFLLNPDTELIDDALAVLVAYMDAHPDVGIAGPHTLNSDGTTQSTRRRFPTLAVGFYESTWLQPYAPRTLLARYYAEDVADDTIADVDWVQGSALLARRDVYDALGGLDEGYVMYCEELDWCKQAKGAGWRVVYVGTAHITHHGGKSSEQVGARKHILFQASKLRYFRKHHGALASGVLRAFLWLSYAWQLALEGAKWLVGHKRALRAERVRTYWQVLWHGF